MTVGFSTKSRTLCGRCTTASSSRSREGMPHMSFSGLSATGSRRRPNPNVKISCAKSWRGCAAERPLARASRVSASRRRTGSSPTSLPSATPSSSRAWPCRGWARTSSTSKTRVFATETATCCARSRGGSLPASAPQSSAPTERESRRFWASSRARSRRRRAESNAERP